MPKPKLPYLQLYTGDWLKDPCVSRCCPATRGIWLDLLCAIHELRNSGRITGTPIELARVCRCTVNEFVDAANELQASKTANITVRENRYTIVNRRMKRGAKSIQKPRKKLHTQNEGRKLKFGEQKTYGKNKKPPSIPNPIAFSNSSAKPISDCLTDFFANKDLVVGKAAEEFCIAINSIFRPNKREATTFAYITQHLKKIAFKEKNCMVFDRVIKWAEECRQARGVKNKKGLFVAKVKKELGYRPQKKIL